MDINRRHLGIICLCVITIILFAGLWPREFHFENRVALLPDSNGIRFSGRGILYSQPLSAKHYQPDRSTQGSLTIEMAVQPEKEWGRSIPIIIAIDDGQACERLLIGQWKKHLIIRSRHNACFQSGDYAEFDLDNSLLKGKTQFITITSGNNGTTLYLNGAMIKKNKNFSLLKPGESLSGRLILGNSSNGNQPWLGTVSTLAIYNGILSSGEVLQHFEAFRDKKSLSPEGNSLPITYYRFDERTGPDHKGPLRTGERSDHPGTLYTSSSPDADPALAGFSSEWRLCQRCRDKYIRFYSLRVLSCLVSFRERYCAA